MEVANRQFIMVVPILPIPPILLLPLKLLIMEVVNRRFIMVVSIHIKLVVVKHIQLFGNQ